MKAYSVTWAKHTHRILFVEEEKPFLNVADVQEDDRVPAEMKKIEQTWSDWWKWRDNSNTAGHWRQCYCSVSVEMWQNRRRNENAYLVIL